jgi:DNA-binding transcriptional LysR family regulator
MPLAAMSAGEAAFSRRNPAREIRKHAARIPARQISYRRVTRYPGRHGRCLLLPDRIESFVAPVLHRFHVQHPNVVFNVRMTSTDEAMEALTVGAAEIGLILNPPVRHAIASTTVFHDRMVAAVGPSHPLAKRKVVSLRDLAEFPFVFSPSHRSVCANRSTGSSRAICLSRKYSA